MDWLRSEDLKEEKSVTASMIIIAVEARLPYFVARALPRCYANHQSRMAGQEVKSVWPRFAFCF